MKHLSSFFVIALVFVCGVIVFNEITMPRLSRLDMGRLDQMRMDCVSLGGYPKYILVRRGLVTTSTYDCKFKSSAK